MGNFGFQGTKCKYTEQQQANMARSVSQIAADGTILSPDSTGSNPGGCAGSKNAIFRPQGMATDRRNNIWIASCGNDNVVVFPDGDPDRDRVF